MPRKYFTAEQIISKLREAEVLISEGKTAEEASRALGISEQTYYRWRKEYDGVGTEQVYRLKELRSDCSFQSEKENARLKRLVADLSLDNAILKETLKGTPKPGQTKTSCAKCTSSLSNFRAKSLPGLRTTAIHATLCPTNSKR